MSPTTAAELSLINHTESLEELQQFDQPGEQVLGALAPSRNTYDDGYDALESGLPMHTLTTEPHEFVPVDEPYGAGSVGVEVAEPPQRHIPFGAAALVLAACLTAGAMTAAVVFHDRLPQISALLPATR